MSEQTVVFVTGQARAREAKLAAGLKALGWKIVLITQQPPYGNFAQYFSEIHSTGSPAKALNLARHYKPLVCHVFSWIADEFALCLIENRPCKVLFDPYDMGFGTMKRREDVRRATPWQHFCLEHADGVCCRDLRMNWLIRQGIIPKPKHRILYGDYAWNATSHWQKWSRSRGMSLDEIHVVQAGFFTVEKVSRDAGALHIAEGFCSQGIHFHVYPHPVQVPSDRAKFEALFEDYLRLQESCPQFHLHMPVPADRLVEELAPYHMAINVHQPFLEEQALQDYDEEDLRRGGSTRIMDYIEAGLPVILHPKERYLFSMLRRHGLVLEATKGLLGAGRKTLEEFLRDPRLGENLRRFQEHHSIARNIGRLEEFYARVAGDDV